ncbi:MAG: hypothetical protein EB105_03510 [Actinobacteria bacterium]|nr:hypothetical protein [Actinomycetota bacterium]
MKPAKEVIRSVRANFAQREIPDVDAEIIVAHVLGIERMDLHRKSYEINGEQLSEIDELVAQRINGVPTQYLVGEAPFRYLTFEVGPGVLIPRPVMASLSFSTATTCTGSSRCRASCAIEIAIAPLPEPRSRTEIALLVSRLKDEKSLSISTIAASTSSSVSGRGIKTPGPTSKVR